jgi:predicted RNA binding protein YcfA (HicA-like mRNA interferase family)
LAKFGFAIVRIRGSHHCLERIEGGVTQTVIVALHGNKPIPLPTLRRIYRDTCKFVPEDELRSYFYAG